MRPVIKHLDKKSLRRLYCICRRTIWNEGPKVLAIDKATGEGAISATRAGMLYKAISCLLDESPEANSVGLGLEVEA